MPFRKVAEGDLEYAKILKWLSDTQRSTAETTYRTSAKESYEFYAGKQDDDDVLVKLANANRPNSVFNESKPKVDMLVGMAAQSPTTSVAVPVGEEDEAFSELINATFTHYQKRMEINRKRNKCFEHACKSGRSLHWFWVDKTNPFKAQLKSKRWRGDQFYCDPNAVTMDLTVDGDHRFIFLEKWVDEDQLQIVIPRKYHSEIEQFKNATTEADGLDFWNQARDLYRLMEVWYFKMEEVYWFINPISQEVEGLTDKEFSEWRKAVLAGIPLDKQGVNVFQMDSAQFKEWEAQEVTQSYRKWPYYKIFVGYYIIEEGRSPLKYAGIPGVLYGAYKDDNNNVWLSVIEAMKDPQRALNTLVRQLIYLLQTLPKGILIHELGAVVDIENYEQHSAEPNFHLEVQRGAIEKIRFEHQPPISPVYQQLIPIFLSAIKSGSGIHDDVMGIETSSREATSTLRARQQTTFAVLYILYDNFRVSRFRESKLLLSLIQQYVKEPEWVRITGPEGIKAFQINSQLNPQLKDFNDISALEYDIEQDEVNETATVRMMVASMLTDFSHNNPNIIPPDVILEYMNMPFTVKQRIRQSWEAAQEAKQEEADREYNLELLKIKSQVEGQKERTKKNGTGT